MFLKKNELTFSSISIITLFIGTAGIGLGSAYYHLNPTNETLVWDRIPMTIVFMSFLSIVLSRYINTKFGNVILFPLLIIGVGSVIHWYKGEMEGAGDLRLYALVQFYPMVLVPLIIFLYPTSKEFRTKIVSVIGVYAIAKFFEKHDVTIYSAANLISGHSLKHLFAAGSILIILLMLEHKKHVT